MATRKRSATSTSPPSAQALDVDSLAAFMGIDQPDRDRLGHALELATAAAKTITGQIIGDMEPHGIRHGVHMLASELLIRDQLEDIPEPSAIPLVEIGRAHV